MARGGLLLAHKQGLSRMYPAGGFPIAPHFLQVALSVAMSATSTFCALFMLPLNILIYIDSGLADDSDLSLPLVDIFVTLLTIIVPVCKTAQSK